MEQAAWHKLRKGQVYFFRAHRCVAMCEQGGWNENGRTCGKLNDDSQLRKIQVAALLSVKAPAGLNGAEGLRRIPRIFVWLATNTRSKVEGGSVVCVASPILCDALVVAAYLVNDVVDTVVDFWRPKLESR